MTTLSYIDRFDFPEKSGSLQCADICLTPLRIAFGRGHYTLDNINLDNKIYPLAMRIFAGIGALVLLPLTLAALTLKWLKRDEWQQIELDLVEPEEIPADQKEILDEEEVAPSPSIDPHLTQDEFNQKLKQDLSCAHHLDVKFGPSEKGTWRKYGESCGEHNQTFEDYVADRMYENPEYDIKKKAWPDRKPLVIKLIGAFDEVDKKIIAITVDFLEKFHQVSIQLDESVVTMDDLKSQYLTIMQKRVEDKKTSEDYLQFMEQRLERSFPRQNGQYDGACAIDVIGATLLPKIEEAANEPCDLITFTTEDLFTPQLQNFVFGCASLISRVGIWSNARFGNPKESAASFEKCLLRMMKISAHEFGHMRGLPHCTDYECNIGGYMSATELDRRPLFYCLQDTAKICSLGQTSLLDYHKNLLKFFQNFNKKYEMNCDLSREIDTLRGRITVLEKA